MSSNFVPLASWDADSKCLVASPAGMSILLANRSARHVLFFGSHPLVAVPSQDPVLWVWPQLLEDGEDEQVQSSSCSTGLGLGE